MRNLRKIITIFATIALLSVFMLSPGQTDAAQAAPKVTTVVYNLYATDGYIELPDGLPLYMYGFIGGRDGTTFTYTPSFTGVAPANQSALSIAPQGGPWAGIDATLAGNAQFPAPIIYAARKDIVEIRLKNLGVAANPAAPNDPHSIHLHGLDVDAANDGVPETSLGAVPANLCLDGTSATDCTDAGGPAPGAGNVIVYMFSPTMPGTYMYHCHQEADIHVQMGMYGALVVYEKGDPAALTGPGMGMGGTLYGVPYDKDYVMLLSEFDVHGHQAEEGTYFAQEWEPTEYNWALYQPQYWQINGLSFPNTIHAGWPSGYTYADWLLAHPGYETLYTGSIGAIPSTAGWGTAGQKVLLRVINMGFETHPLHMHGYHGKVIGSDARGWTWATMLAPGAGLEKNTLLIGSGETYDWVIDFGLQSFQSTYPAQTQTRYDPATTNLPQVNTLTGLPVIPEAGAVGGPTYIGGPTVTGAVGIPFTSQFFPFHNHDDYKATNNGVYPGGMFTMLVPTP